ncbi:MAG: transporter substrate-binding domain-containing protein [Methylocystaceae bacterium]|nr:transporter substrate-binding domain-containing protein [Methylocystaceae bacterium]
MSMQALAQEGLVHIGVLKYPPYIIQPDRSYPGAQVEVLRKSFENVGIETKFDILPYTRTIQHVEEGTLPVVGMLNAKTSDKVRLSKHHTLSLVQTFFVSKTKNWSYEGVHSLDGQTILSVEGYNYQNVSPSYQFLIESDINVMTIKAVKNYLQTAAYILSHGRADVFNEDYAAMTYALDQMEMIGVVKAAGTLPIKLKQYVGFAPNEEGDFFRQKFDEGFEMLLTSGELDRILKKYDATRIP